MNMPVNSGPKKATLFGNGVQVQWASLAPNPVWLVFLQKGTFGYRHREPWVLSWVLLLQRGLALPARFHPYTRATVPAHCSKTSKCKYLVTVTLEI